MTPPHWKSEQSKLRPLYREKQKAPPVEADGRWVKGDKLDGTPEYRDRYGNWVKNRSSSEDSIERERRERREVDIKRLQAEASTLEKKKSKKEKRWDGCHDS